MAPSSQMRWQLADDPTGQGELFDQVYEREPGRGEFRGLEFLHVRARRIINEVPKASRMPFRYTINAYRGCSHACSYCQAGDTPILMGDGTTKPLAELRVGDEIYGTEERGAYRRFVKTTVLDHWSTTRTAYRVTLDDGTTLVASADHRYLSNRGWKHVVGAEQGSLQRPHLTTRNKLMGTGGFAVGPKQDEDYRFGYLAGMIRGDANLGVYEDRRPHRNSRLRYCFRLALVDQEPLDRARVYLGMLGLDLAEFVFAEATSTRKALRAIRAQSKAAFDLINASIAWPSYPSDEWVKGFLAGIFDAEGGYSRGVLRISNTDEDIIAALTSGLERFGFEFRVEHVERAKPMKVIRLLGGVCEHLRFFHTVDPATTRKRTIDGVAIKTKARLRVGSIEPLGLEIPMYDITTGTGDFIANGVVSHNCFARPTHEYLNLDAARDFETKIVVKLNAVERLRAELDPRRWPGDHIAMGTNTDPYQRCEGKYHLTEGIVEVLSEARNPFSILTKSTLILRDIDLLREASQRTDVGINFSIGTLDEEVWKLSEPGTPHPGRRVEAVSKLNEAGVRCGVLVAPILPGLSDRPEQVEEVVKACAEAGATNISGITLHLRKGVREQFMPWLETTRPDLVGHYQRLYPRSYAPKAEQNRVSGMIREAAERHGGRRRSPPATRQVAAPEPRPQLEQPPAPEQLGLSL